MKQKRDWRTKIHEVIFEADTFWGKFFDMALLFVILLSIIAVILESVPDMPLHIRRGLYISEWVFTVLFTIEYLFRIISARKPLNYIFSRYGIIDFLSIVPTYFSYFYIGTQYLLIIRALRLLRIFRILKMASFLHEGNILTGAIYSSARKIGIFISFILVLVIILGAVMYVIEGGVQGGKGFISIPDSIYWAVVTLTTVGYGDITPVTFLGKFFASLIMLAGYAIIAVPTGIMSAALIKAERKDITAQTCPSCYKQGHDKDAVYCKYCGGPL
jgi:voltage-gated potassium channel